MVRLLLDTHAFLWWIDDLPQLGCRARDEILKADIVRVSLVVWWEVAIKIATGKLGVDLRHLIASARDEGFSTLMPTEAHCLRLTTLPLHHRDPFDRMMIAQALDDRLTVVTRDRKFAAYGVPLLPCG